VCPAPKYNVEVCGLGERAEVPVARDERNTLIDTALGDQRIAETRLAALCEHLRRATPPPAANSQMRPSIRGTSEIVSATSEEARVHSIVP